MNKKIKEFISGVILGYIPNYIINKIPSYFLRNLYYKKIMRIKLGKNSSIHLNCFIEKGVNSIGEIGENSTINRSCYLDFRGGLEIGKNVSISPYVKIITASHDMNTNDFMFIKKKVIIEDYVWIGTSAIILPGVKLKKGAVVGAGAVVTKDVSENTFVVGSPALKKGMRQKEQDYSTKYLKLFD